MENDFQDDPAGSCDEVRRAVEDYSNMLFKICIVMLCNEYDAEEAVQETFLRYMTKAPAFNGAEHEKAWLIRVATNICRDMQRFRVRHQHLNIDDLYDYYRTEENSGILEAVMKLPQDYKIVIMLFYIEGYNVDGISQITGASVSAVKKRLQRGREKLRLDYRKDYLS
ncbi:MAG: RNA polymerase sigma factor [Saccharofermentanales bacterium]